MLAKSDLTSKSRWFLIVLNVLIRAYISFYMIIPDCDETFNYWDPLNLLIRKFGKQTWEYSPEYAIRSYAFLTPYYLIDYPFHYLNQFFKFPSYFEFYWIRLIGLNGLTSLSEILLTSSLSENFGAKIGNWYLFLSSINTGMSHAGVALLPSSFAMQMIIFAINKSLNAINSNDSDLKVKNSVKTFFWFGLGGLFGWPFILVLSVPFAFYTLFSSSLNQLWQIGLKSAIKVFGLILVISGIDNLYYKFNHFFFVPLNIVLYNVFGGEGEGPEIFGVEPFSYYVANLLLNFNLIMILGFVGILVNFFIYEYKYKSKILVGIISPLVIWSTIFGIQPHKEERFLYPIYPLIIINASLLINKLFILLNTIRNKLRLPKSITFSMQLLFAISIGLISISRIFNLIENYRAPLTVPTVLAQESNTGLQNVCVGREWYHFPNSFFLPDNYRLRFVKSGFDGLLPGDFLEAAAILDSTSNIPSDMNNKNEFSESKLIDFEQCDYYFDNSQPINENVGEPQMFIDGQVRPDWQILKCDKLINPDGDHQGIGRLLYIPTIFRNHIPNEVVYMDLCVFKKEKR